MSRRPYCADTHHRTASRRLAAQSGRALESAWRRAGVAPPPPQRRRTGWGAQHVGQCVGVRQWWLHALISLFLLTSGMDFDLTFNDSLAAFIPKGDEEDDKTGCIKRRALNTRPLGLKNSNNKLVAGVSCSSFDPVV